MKPPLKNHPTEPEPAATHAASAPVLGQFMEGLALHRQGRLAEAQHLYRQVLEVQPRHSDALHLMGVIARQTNNPLQAIELIGRAIEIDPGNAAAYINRGNALKDLRRPDEALESYDRALIIKPDFAEALRNRGDALWDLKRLDEALESYDGALRIKPDDADALNSRGNTLKELNRLDEALESYDRALIIKPDFAAGFCNRGVTLKELKRPDEALESYDRALRIKPDFAEALSNRGNTLKELRRLDEALESCDRALRIQPDYAEALVNRGVTLLELKRFDEALESCNRALDIKPDYAGALFNRGVTLHELGRLAEALASYRRALEIKPDYVEALIRLGAAFEKLKRLDEALDSYDRALTIKPDYDFLYGIRLYVKMHLCDWTDPGTPLADLATRIHCGEKLIPPFALLALTDSLSLQRKAAGIWTDSMHPPASAGLPYIPKRARRGKIRIGYYSADFHNHATMYLMAELFELHDRDKFELVAFSFGTDENDEMHRRVSVAFDRFIDVRSKADKDLALLSRDLEIDVAVDLKGFTRYARVDTFSCRAAPVQVSFLGYPGTMGAEYMDYLIADRTTIPEASRLQYAEKIVYLPNSYQVNDRKRRIADKTFSRQEFGLPSTGFVFCCFNNNYKTTPAAFDGWMRILKQVEGSVLWLLEDNLSAARNLRKEAEARGVSAERVVFARRMPLADHLARHCAGDLFLDTLPCNAHTTASDALWAGLPVLTCMGEAFAGRVAASLLNAIDLPELITTTQEQYEALAIELATDPARLKQIKQKLERNRLTTPLFDTPLYTRHLESAYTQMYERYQADLPPEHIYVGQ